MLNFEFTEKLYFLYDALTVFAAQHSLYPQLSSERDDEKDSIRIELASENIWDDAYINPEDVSCVSKVLTTDDFMNLTPMDLLDILNDMLTDFNK